MADFNASFHAVLSDMSDLVQELQLQAFARKFPEGGVEDPTWRAWSAWAQVAELRQETAELEQAGGLQ